MYWPLGTAEAFEQGVPNTLDVASREASSTREEQQERDLDDQVAEDLDIEESPGATTTNDSHAQDNGNILVFRVARAGHVLVTITRKTLTVWQVKPTAILTVVTRSHDSMKIHGANIGVSLRPDAAIVVLQTSLGYLITYSLKTYANVSTYQLQFPEGYRSRFQRQSATLSNKHAATARGIAQDGQGTIYAATLRCKRIDLLGTDVLDVLATDHEMVISTRDPPSVQCVSWGAEEADTVEITTDLEWMHGSAPVVAMIHDKPMRLYTWISENGTAYAVQRGTSLLETPQEEKTPLQDDNSTTAGTPVTEKSSLQLQRTRSQGEKAGFVGYGFYTPDTAESSAAKATINSRFSLVALGLRNGTILVYHVRDYQGGINLVQKIEPPTLSSTSGQLNALEYSPDGCCLLAGYERGWSTWSVFGQALYSSFGCDRDQAQTNGDQWLLGLQSACWIGNGSEVVMLAPNSRQLWLLDFARSALTNSFTFANVHNALLQTKDGFMIYQGHEYPDLTAITTDLSLWHQAQAPFDYLMEQWPLRAAVVSPDGRYLAIAGQRGLAHYSVGSGRWKTFEDSTVQNDFIVRGGMCWYQHVLIVAVECSSGFELRLYAREQTLGTQKPMHVTTLTAAVVHLAQSGDDSILVYSSDNVLDHYIVVVHHKDVSLVKVGQIALHGIIRAPARVRSVSWVVPEHHLNTGDASRDVAVASIFFLVDGNLILLQPHETEGGELKYDMRVISHNVEYYLLTMENTTESIDSDDTVAIESDQAGIRESLWIFNGQMMKMWPDVNNLLQLPSGHEENRVIPEAVQIPVDYYPVSPLLDKGILLGMEAELTQRREGGFSLHRTNDRTTLFLPSVLYHHLSNGDSAAAQQVAQRYQHLTYFAHALEVLLHNVLDDEVERGPGAEKAMLPVVLSFLSTFPDYLDIVVQCTRKTELRSWRTLFAHLPPPEDLFEAAMRAGQLKTAGGYLLVLHTLSEISSTSPQVVRLLRAARAGEDWDLCKELARFLVALDETGATLRQALDLMEVATPAQTRRHSRAAAMGPASTNGVRGVEETLAGDGLHIFTTMEQQRQV